MKSYRKELHFHTKTRRAYIYITPQIEAALAESGHGQPWEGGFGRFPNSSK